MMVKPVIEVVFGAGLAFVFHKFVGCSTGACPLTRHPTISSAIPVAALGSLVVTSFH
jgi:hypothetical protein